MNGWRVILQVETPSRQECRRLSDVPSLDPAHIALFAETSRAAHVAERIFQGLLRSISEVTPVPASVCDGPRLLNCQGRREPTCHSVLVAVTDSNLISPRFQQLIQDWYSQGPPGSVVLPILPAGVAPSAVLPPQLDEIAALFDFGAPETLASDVLRTARLAGADQRLFISYRRTDAQIVAEQLHHAFVRKGFRVFLDRFVGTPGRMFPQELGEELADKGIVLVIESPGVASSPWTLAEVAFALNLHLGLFAVRPGAPRFAAIQERFDARAGKLWRKAKRPSLTNKAVEDVVAFVRSGYMRQAFRRRVFLESKLRRVLGGVPPVVTDGLYEAGAYIVYLAARPPRLNDLRRPIVAGRSMKKRPVVVGPVGLLPSDVASDIRWLAADTSLSLVDEGNMRGMARSMKLGKVPL